MVEVGLAEEQVAVAVPRHGLPHPQKEHRFPLALGLLVRLPLADQHEVRPSSELGLPLPHPRQ